MKLQETFSSPESRIIRAVMFIDLTDSTGMKESQPEANWLNTLGWFYDLIVTKITEYGGSIVKFIGDGALVVFDMDHVAEAINAAISLQEKTIQDRDSHLIDCYASIGIATGRTVRFKHFQEQEDYVGTVVDLASRLCSAASPQAILVDTETVNHANMRKVVSQIGRLNSPPRSAQQYQGEVYTFSAKGFKNAVKYHQIFWGSHPYGLKPEFVQKNIPNETYQEAQYETYQEPHSTLASERSLDEWLRKAHYLWNNGQRKESIELCMLLSQKGSGGADELIFQMAQTLISESVQESNPEKGRYALELLNYVANEGHQGAIKIIEELKQRSYER